MREIEHLQKQWRESARFRGLHASMSFENDALVLGADTVLVKRKADGALVLDGAEMRLLILLSVAQGRPIGASILKNFRRASDCAKAGDACMASMHVALALPALDDPERAAQRLFMVDGLLAAGAPPRDIWAALAFDPAILDVLAKKFNPDEPRNPGGDGSASGEWTVNWGDASVVPPAGTTDETLAVRGQYGRHLLTMQRETQYGAGEAHQAAAVVSSGKKIPMAASLTALFSSPANRARSTISWMRKARPGRNSSKSATPPTGTAISRRHGRPWRQPIRTRSSPRSAPLSSGLTTTRWPRM